MDRKPPEHKIVDDLSNPNFASKLRSIRCGFKWSPKHHAFIRITDSLNCRYYIEVINWIDMLSITPDDIEKSAYQWWLYDGILDNIYFLRNVFQPKEPMKVIVNIDGHEVYGNNT